MAFPNLRHNPGNVTTIGSGRVAVAALSAL
jgi:hypothetical protein